MEEGQRRWEAGPLPEYCMGRAMLLDREAKRVGKGSPPYTKEERDAILKEYSAVLEEPKKKRGQPRPTPAELREWRARKEAFVREATARAVDRARANLNLA